MTHSCATVTSGRDRIRRSRPFCAPRSGPYVLGRTVLGRTVLGRHRSGRPSFAAGWAPRAVASSVVISCASCASSLRTSDCSPDSREISLVASSSRRRASASARCRVCSAASSDSSRSRSATRLALACNCSACSRAAASCSEICCSRSCSAADRLADCCSSREARVISVCSTSCRCASASVRAFSMMFVDSRLAELRMSEASCSAMRSSFSARNPKLSSFAAGSRWADFARASRSSLPVPSASATARSRSARRSASSARRLDRSLSRWAR